MSALRLFSSGSTIRRTAQRKVSAMQRSSAVPTIRRSWWDVDFRPRVPRSQPLIFAALVLALRMGGQSRVCAQSACDPTSPSLFQVEDLDGAQALRAAVSCADFGTVEATWSGVITLDEPISIEARTFLNITGEDELAEVRGGYQTRMFEVSEAGSLSLSELKLSGGRAEGGGAIYSRGANVTLESCMFEGNVAYAGNGGAVWAKGGTLTIVGGHFANNNATGKGGAVHVEDELLVVEEGTRFYNNSAESMGGAFHGGTGSSITIHGCSFEDNFTSGSGGGIATSSARLTLSALRTDNLAGENGAGVAGWDGDVIANGTTMRGNRAGEEGGCMYAGIGSEIDVHDGNFTGNRATENGGFLYAAKTAAVTIWGGTVSNNVAERRAGAIYCSGPSSGSGVAKVTIEGGTFSGNEALEHGGAIVAWGIATVVTITGGDFVDNIARYFGGFIFLEEEASLSCTGARILGNIAGDQGGGIYARDATWVLSSCDLIENKAAQGPAAYLTHVRSALFQNHTIIDTSETGAAAVFATETSFFSRRVEFRSDVVIADDSSHRAVQLEGATTLVAEECVFRGWAGDAVVYHANAAAGSLVLNACDFTRSSTVMVIKSPNSEAEIRNALIGDLTIENADTIDESPVLVDRALTCDDPGACGTGECVDSILGVLCECLEEDVCLDDGGALSVSLNTAAPDVTFDPNPVQFELTVSANADGTTPVIWRLVYDSDDLDLQPLPPSGVLPPGGNVTVTVTGSPSKLDLGGILVSRFGVASVSSDSPDGTSGAELYLYVPSVFFYCQAFEYATPADDDGVTCEQCAAVRGAEGLNCEERGATLASMPVRKGYWRSGQDSLVIHSCLHSEACTGATQVFSADDYCEDGYEGPYCAVCSEGYGPGADNACHSCTNAVSRWLIFAGSVFVLVVSLVAFVAIVFLIGGSTAVEGIRRSLTRATTPQGSERSSSRCTGLGEVLKRWVSRVPQTKVRILVVVWQILTVYPSVTGVSFPPVYSRFLSWIDVVNFDVGSIFSTACIMPKVGFYNRLLVTTLVPLGLAAVLVPTYRIAKRRAGIGSASLTVMKAAWSRHMAAGLLLTFLVFTSTSTVAFEAFACDEQAVEGESLLRADYSLSCRTTEHKWWMVYAGIMIVVYPIGVPLLYASILWKNRADLNPTAQSTETCTSSKMIKFLAMGGVAAKGSTEELEERLEQRKQNPDLVPSMFLWKDFGPDMYYYEVIECGRRILLTGALIFIAPNTAAQAAVACMFAFASLLGFEILRPHLDPIDSWLYRLGCVVIFLSNFLALLIKADAAGEDNRSFLGGVMVSINILLILTVLFASYLTAQQTVEGPLVENHAFTFSGAMRTIEQRTTGKGRSTREETAAPVSSFRSRGGSDNGVDGFNQRKGPSACVWPRLVQEGLVDDASDAAIPSAPVEPVGYARSSKDRGRRPTLLARAGFTRAPHTRVPPVRRSPQTFGMLVEFSDGEEHGSGHVSLSHSPTGPAQVQASQL